MAAKEIRKHKGLDLKNIEIKRISSENEEALINLYREHREWSPPAKFGEGLIKYPAFAAYKDNKIIGFVTLAYFAPDIIELYNIFIAKEFRNQKIGSALLQALELSLKDTSFKNIILINSKGYKTYDEKIVPKNFYSRNGYEAIKKTSSTYVYFKQLSF